LTVNVTTPAGVTGSVTVTGPNGYSKTLAATQSLTGLPAGTYTIVGAPVVTASSIVGSDTNTATVTGSPATVGRSATATVTVAYAAGTSTAGLWVINARNQVGSNQLVEFGATQLTASGSPAPVAGFLGQVGNQVAAVAFDRQGNLWSVGDGTITEYTEAQLDSTNPAPVLAITLQNPTVVSSIAFDSSGNLWMVAPGPCQFYEYSAATLATQHGAVMLTPDISITPNCGLGEEPWAIAFDTHWNMWVSDNVSEVVYEYPADSLKQGFSGLFTTRLFAVNRTQYLAFDATGNLWITNGDAVRADSTLEYSTAQLADTTAAPVPHTAISLSTSGALQGLAFDNSGNLWTADVETNNLYELSAAQLAASGAVTPAVVIGANITSLSGPDGLAFAPHSSGLPLFAHLAPPPASTRGRVRR
jgi:ligand-binding sensor domain-containing protein